MAIYHVRRPSSRQPTTVNLIEMSALLAALLVTLVGNIYVMEKTSPLSRGDMWRHLAQALQYSKGFPVHGGMLIPGYPYFFHVYLTTLFQLSGLPPPISYQALFAFSFIPILSFYSFIKEWFSEKNLCSIAIILVPLLGFGSLYAINLKAQNPSMPLSTAVPEAIHKTYDINDIMVIGPALANVVPILYIALPTLFMFLYLLKKSMNNVTKSFLYAVLVAVSFLGHPDAPFFMGLALLLYAAIMEGEGVKVGAIGGILGLLIVALVDSSAPARNYILALGGISSASTLTFFVMFLLFVLSYFTSVLARHFTINHSFLSDRFKKNAFSLTSGIIIFAYLFSLITWVYVLPTYDAYKFGGYDFTPFFIWPIRFGPIGLLSILCLSLYLGDVAKDRRLTFFSAIAAIGFVMEQLANYYPIYPAYRFATLTLIGVVVLAAYFVIKSASLLTRKKKLVLPALLISVMIPGMLSSSLFYYDRARLNPSINSYELDALSFVGKNLPLNSSVLTVTDDSATKLETFGGINTIQIMQRWNYIFLSEVDLSTFLYLLGTSNVKYIYLSLNDFEVLNHSKSMLYDLLDYLPVAFQNEGVKVYEIPRMVPPSAQSNFTMLNFFEFDTTKHVTLQNEFLLQIIPSFLRLNYTILSLPIETNRTSISIAGLQNPLQWVITEGTGNISLNETNIEDSVTIAVQNLTADKSGYFALGTKYTCDFTPFDYLQLWIKTSSDVDGELKVILRGDNNTWAAWLVQIFPKNEWFPLTLRLTEPNLESTTKLNLSTVRQIDVGFQRLHPMTNYSFLKIREIQGIISSRFLSYEALGILPKPSTIILTHDPNFDVSCLLKLAESGSKIIVFDTNDEDKGFFFNFLQLAVEGYIESNKIALLTNINIPQTRVHSISTNSSGVSSIAYYKLGEASVAPFTLVKKIGLGEIVYIILPSKIINTSEKTLVLLMKIFNEILDMLELQTKTYKYTPYYFGSYNTLESLTTLNGKVKITSEHIFNTNPLRSSRLEIKIGSTSRILVNATVESLKIYGPAQLIIDGRSIYMRANSVPSYLTFSSDKFECSCLFNFSDNTIVELRIMNSSEPFSLSMNGGSLLLDTSELSILVKHPSIETQGDVYFESARIHYINPYVPLAGVVRDSLKISGRTVFTVQFAFKDLSIITGFLYDGTAAANKIQTTTHLNIPLANLLTSPLLFVFYLLLFIFALLSIIRNTTVPNRG
jgi:hypothetical protein